MTSLPQTLEWIEQIEVAAAEHGLTSQRNAHWDPKVAVMPNSNHPTLIVELGHARLFVSNAGVFFTPDGRIGSGWIAVANWGPDDEAYDPLILAAKIHERLKHGAPDA